MTEKERYETILAVLAEKVQEQARKIGFLEWENTDLKKKIAEAEASAKTEKTKSEKEIKK